MAAGPHHRRELSLTPRRGFTRPRLWCGRRRYIDNVSSGSLPVLPPIRSTGTSILSISVTSKFAIVGLSEYERWRPPLSVPAPPPITRSGRLSPECLVLLEMPEPYRIVV